MRNHEGFLFFSSAIWYFTVSTNEQGTSFHILRQWCKQGCLAFSPLFFLLHALSITRWRCRYSRAPAGWLGGWLACLLETSEIWFTLRACCSKPYPTVCIFPPLFVTVGCTCAGGEGWGWGVPSRHATLHFSGWAQGQEHIWLTKGGRGFRLCVCMCVCFRFRNFHTHKPHSHIQSSLVAVQPEHVCIKQQQQHTNSKTRHTGALLHKQTNTPAAPGKSLWQSAEGGKANKTNSLIYMTVACFTLACRGNDRVKLCWKQQVMKSDGPICGIL